MRPVHLLLLAGLTARAVDAQDYQCFTSYQELYDAVVDFLNNIPAVGQTYGPVMADWCTGAVDKFSFMFFGLDFDGPLNWDTSNGVQFTSMFERSPYNQPLDWLNLSSAEDVSNMFKDTTAFNQPLAINTSNVQTFTGMFEGSQAFNQDITLDTSSATTLDSMFKNTKVFNGNLGFTTLSSVTRMQSFLEGAEAYNKPIALASTSVNDFDRFLANNKVYSQPISLDLGQARTMQEFFKNSNYNLDIDFSTAGRLINTKGFLAGNVDFDSSLLINMEKVQNMESMFDGAVKFNDPNVVDWSTSQVNNMKRAFAGATSFQQDITGWDVSSVTDLTETFNGASVFDQPLCDWGAQIDAATIVVGNTFQGTACEEQGDPDFALAIPGPFCVPCGNAGPGIEPTAAPSPAPAPAPTVAPAPGPTTAPVPAPTTTPVVGPTSVPIEPTSTPVSTPVPTMAAETPAPTEAPVTTPVTAPVTPPTQLPVAPTPTADSVPDVQQCLRYTQLRCSCALHDKLSPCLTLRTLECTLPKEFSQRRAFLKNVRDQFRRWCNN